MIITVTTFLIRLEPRPRSPADIMPPYPKNAVGKGGRDGRFLKLGSSLKLTVYHGLSKL